MQKPPPIPQAPWLDVARGELGVTELAGSVHNNPRVLEYFSATRTHATSDEVPWCAAFVCWCLERAGVDSPQDARARSFIHWGAPLTTPRPGAIMVYASPARGPDAGHVALFVAPRERAAAWSRSAHGALDDVLGGNQRNGVRVLPYPREHLLAIRWPA